MINATGRTGDNRPLLVIGLSGENMARLMAGEPITFGTAALGKGMPDVQIVIVGGRTNADIMETLKRAPRGQKP